MLVFNANAKIITR